MRNLILIMLISLLPISLKAQSMPHSFTDGDIIYADQINENFEYLLKKPTTFFWRYHHQHV